MDNQISVIIISLNEENYLPLLLQDLAEQTMKKFEVIVVDAKSTDKTKEKALLFKNILKLQFIESPKGQVSYQRNLGAKHAKNEYLFFLDADSRIQKNVIEKLTNCINKKNVTILLPKISPVTQTFFNNLLFNAAIKGVKLLYILHRPLSLGPLFVMKKSIFNELKGFDEKVAIGEDHNIIIRGYKLGYKPDFVDDVPVGYSMRRFESKGTWNLIRTYAKYTTLILLHGGIYSRSEEYIMGGDQYK